MPRDVVPNQFAYGQTGELSAEDAASFCGPVAAIAFARANGRNPTAAEAKALAVQVGWTARAGMAGIASEQKLLNLMGYQSELDTSGNWQRIQQAVQSGQKVILSNALHYFYVDGFDPGTGKYHVGTSGKVYRGGSDWMSGKEIEARSALTGALFMDQAVVSDQGGGGQTRESGAKRAAPLIGGKMAVRGPQDITRDFPAAPPAGPLPEEASITTKQQQIAALEAEIAALEPRTHEMDALGENLSGDAKTAVDQIKAKQSRIDNLRDDVADLEVKVAEKKAKVTEEAAPANKQQVGGGTDQPYIGYFDPDTGQYVLEANRYYQPEPGSAPPTPPDQWVPVTDPNSGAIIALQDPATGKTMDLPAMPEDALAGDPLVREIGGNLYQYDPASGGWVVAVQGPEAQTNPLDDEYSRLRNATLARGLIPEQQLLIDNTYDTINQIEGMIASGQMNPKEGQTLIDGLSASMQSALRGTSPFQEEQSRLQDQRERGRMGIDLLNQRVSSGTGLAAALTSSASGLAQSTMMPAGKTSIGYSPAELGVAITEMLGGGTEVKGLAMELLRAAGGGGSQMPAGGQSGGMAAAQPAAPDFQALAQQGREMVAAGGQRHRIPPGAAGTPAGRY